MFVNKKHFRYFELKFINHNYLNFSGQILKKVNSIDLGQKKRFFLNFFADSDSSSNFNLELNWI